MSEGDRTKLTDDQPRQIHLRQQLVLLRGRVHGIIPVQHIMHRDNRRKSRLKAIHQQRKLMRARRALALDAKTVNREQNDRQGVGKLKVHEQPHPAVVARRCLGRPLHDWIVELRNVVLLQPVKEVQRGASWFREGFGEEVEAINDCPVLSASDPRVFHRQGSTKLTADDWQLDDAPREPDVIECALVVGRHCKRVRR